MSGDLLLLLGGIGLFLFGMQTMTTALRELASDRARGLLAGFTRTPLSGALTGAATTAAIQSSSATMVMTVGFVGAGLMAFPQALGVLYGASVGTTFTGWLVLFVGFRLKLGVIALPLLFLASLIALLGPGQLARAGRGLAGFALVFIGLDMMQAAMAAWEGQITPASFPDAGPWGRAQLVAIGIAVTMLTQSSSAGVAAVLVLLSGGAIGFEQAASLVVGMHVGTTFTAFLAAVGGNRAVQQTALANLLYHIAGGLLALVLIDPFAAVLARETLGNDAQLALVLFHTGFNLAGVAVMLPLTPAFAALIIRLLPEREEARPSALLDRRLLSDSAAALDVSGRVLQEVANALFAALAAALRDSVPHEALANAAARAAEELEEVQGFVARIGVSEDDERGLSRLNAQLQQLDHLRRLQYRATQAARLRRAARTDRLRHGVRLLAGCLERHAIEGGDGALEARLARLETRLARIEARVRHSVLRHPPHVLGLTVAEVMQVADALRWLRRAATHVQRIVHYERMAWTPPGSPAEPPPDQATARAAVAQGDGPE
ncbi:MAG: Na/Pi cotransporter family protein [Rhodobacteraceae bacterium]|nr:Na/Pi cotransporter family protein [Paracoccaceae bacterium]